MRETTSETSCAYILKIRESSEMVCNSTRSLSHIKMTVFWFAVPCSLVKIPRRFKSAYCLHHQGEHSHDDGSKHLWNVGSFLSECTVQHLGIRPHSRSSPWQPKISVLITMSHFFGLRSGTCKMWPELAIVTACFTQPPWPFDSNLMTFFISYKRNDHGTNLIHISFCRLTSLLYHITSADGSELRIQAN
jgi:hypothetical protein